MKNIKIIFLFVLVTSLVLVNSCSKDDSSTTPSGGGNSAPNAPSNPSPADSSINVSRLVTLTWTCSDPNTGDTLRYDVLAGSTNPPTNMVANNILAASTDLGLVAANTTIYWYVSAKDNHNSFTNGPVWRFTTGN